MKKQLSLQDDDPIPLNKEWLWTGMFWLFLLFLLGIAITFRCNYFN